MSNPTSSERDERITVPEGTDPAEFLARLLAVDPDDEDEPDRGLGEPGGS